MYVCVHVCVCVLHVCFVRYMILLSFLTKGNITGVMMKGFPEKETF